MRDNDKKNPICIPILMINDINPKQLKHTEVKRIGK